MIKHSTLFKILLIVLLSCAQPAQASQVFYIGGSGAPFSGEHAYLMKRLPYEYRWYTTESPDGEYTLNAKATKDGKVVEAQLKVTVKNNQ